MSRAKTMRRIQFWTCRTIGLCLAAWLAFPVPAKAYLPSGPHAIDLIARYLGRPTALTVDQQVTLFPDPPPRPALPGIGDASPAAVASETAPVEVIEAVPVPVVVRETLYYRFPHSFRSETRAADSERIHLAVGGAMLTMVDGVIRPGRDYINDWYKDLLLYRHPAWLASRMASIGIDIGTVSLGRIDDTTVLIVGARFPDLSLPQIWVDKATYRPLRLVLPQPEPEAAIEIRYEEWAEKDGVRYPMRVVYKQGDRVLRHMRVSRVASVATLPNGIFERQPLLEKAKRAPVEDAVDSDRRIQQTIDDFGKRYQ